MVAGASVALTGDAFTPPLRQFTGGLSEPLLVALVLGAVWAALDERPGVALGLGTAAALLRPECWPFLALYAFFGLGRPDGQDESRGGGKQSGPRLAILSIAILVPVAWFVPDLIGAGTPLEGPETARAGGLEPLDALEVLGRALAAPLAAVWIGVALLLWTGRIGIGRSSAHSPDPDRENDPPALDRPLAILLAGAAAWILLVAAMAVVGFAGLPRFLAPATAAIAILGAVGIARAGAAASPRPTRERGRASATYGGLSSTTPSGMATLRALAAAALVLAVAGFGWRVAQVPGDLEVVERQRASLEDLFDLVDQTGSAPLLACSGTVKMTQVRPQTALAWKLEEPISSTPVRRKPLYGIALSTKPLPHGTPFASAGPWRATRLPCPSHRR